MALSVRGLRLSGVQAASFSCRQQRAYAPADYTFLTSNWHSRHLELRAWLAFFALRYDVFHFHYAETLYSEFGLGRGDYPDARLLRRLGKTVVVEFWGSDVRLPSIEHARNPYYVLTQSESDDHREKLKRWAEITGGHVIISDHAFDVFLKDYFPSIHYVSQRFDVAGVTPHYPSPDQRRPVVVHAPSHLVTKGTEFVRAAVERLQARGLAFDYVEVVGRTHSEAMQIYAGADLIVDQLRMGAHGVFAVEAMALGKPVICYILPELAPTYPEGFPIINANPDTLESVLEEWLSRHEDRHHRGVQSRAYVERVHDCRVGAARLLDAYRAIAASQA